MFIRWKNVFFPENFLNSNNSTDIEKFFQRLKLSTMRFKD